MVGARVAGAEGKRHCSRRARIVDRRVVQEPAKGLAVGRGKCGQQRIAGAGRHKMAQRLQAGGVAMRPRLGARAKRQRLVAQAVPLLQEQQMRAFQVVDAERRVF